MKSQSNEKTERPTVTVQAQTANTTSAQIVTKNGTAWLNIGDDSIIITTSELSVEVRP